MFLCSLTRGYLRVAACGLLYSWVVAANFPLSLEIGWISSVATIHLPKPLDAACSVSMFELAIAFPRRKVRRAFLYLSGADILCMSLLCFFPFAVGVLFSSLII